MMETVHELDAGIVPPTSATLQVGTVSATTAVPTASEWALILMAAALAVVAMKKI